MKGAFVEFRQGFLSSLPNVVIFQFNPETMRHSWTQATPPAPGANPQAVPGLPGETFSFLLKLDCTDALAEPETPPTLAGMDARQNGVYSRLAALELLLFPVEQPAGGGNNRAVPAGQLPTVLFVWGKGRIVPVRVTSLAITEQLYDEALNPTHAEAQIEMRVLTTEDLDSLTGTLKTIAQGAYKYTKGKREALAIANLGNSAVSIIALLPNPIPGA